jgi:hypothetical protein
LLRAGGGFFVASSSFGCSVEGRTRVLLFRKGVDVLLGKTSKPQNLKTSNLKPQTSNLKPQTSNLKPQTSNLKPQTN